MKTLLQILAERVSEKGRKLTGDPTYGVGSINPRQLFAAGSSGIVNLELLTDTIRAPIIEAFKGGLASIDGWTKRVPLDNFKQSEVAMVDKPAKLTPIGRGGTAAMMSFGVAAPNSWHLARFGVQFRIDEQDVVAGLPMQPLELALREIGAAARRLESDLVWSYVLSNPTLPDNVALFHSSRGNIATGGSSALDATSLGVAYGAIAGQIITDLEGQPLHLGLQPRHLVAVPGKGIAARGLARLYNLEDDTDLTVCVESRLTSAGVVDPLVGDVVTGNGTNWLLAASAEQSPSILIGSFDGQTEPSIRSGLLSQGEWGAWFDVQYDLAVVAVDGRGLHWSTGA